MKNTILTIFGLLCTLCGNAQVFTVTDKGTAAEVVVSNNDYDAVKIAADNLRSDILMTIPSNITSSSLEGWGSVIAGTIGHSRTIDSLRACHAIDTKEIEGEWEAYVIEQCGKDLIIAGSDRRGTVFGIYEMSKRIGVSPWVWWADVPVKKQRMVSVSGKRYVCKSPAVKYRGIFINDEDWGMQPWAAKNFEKELGDIGPKTYERVCELILRLGGNMLAPAMHDCTGAFYTHPESKVVADRLGVIITTSHCEPMLFNNACKAEWDSKRDGEWNYRTNRGTILGKFANRVAEAYTYDNIYTVAMRGVHDEGMRGQTSAKDRVAVLTDVIKDQRNLLELFTQKPASETPQIFVPYKETLDVYQAGLRLPDDVTIVWPDDNYGFMKRLPTAEERKRSGGSGVYYHLSYLGTPHDYLWLCTTPPSLMLEELGKAYRAGADRYWLLNVGDIKPMELDVQLFFDLARNPSNFDYTSINTLQTDMLAGIFGERHRKDFRYILDRYYNLAWIRKPEYMGWEWQWDSEERCRLRDTDFSFANNEAQQRLYDYHVIAERCRKIMNGLPEESRASFFELLGYPVMAAEQMNRKFLLAQFNHESYASGEYGLANWAADQSQTAADSIEALNREYNTMLDGKWNGMMTVPPGYVSLYHKMPDLSRKDGIGSRTPRWASAAVKMSKPAGVVDITHPTASHNIKMIPGLGYDNTVVELTERDSYVEYRCKTMDKNAKLHINVLPFFPIDEHHSNCISVSIDGNESVVLENKFEEWGYSWKEQVLVNGHEYTVPLPASANGWHTIRISSVDSGQIVQRISL